MERWRAAWREIATALPTAGLDALRTALVTGDERLIRGFNSLPGPDDPTRVEGACAIGYPLWQAMGGDQDAGAVRDVIDDFFTEDLDDLCEDWYAFVGFFDNDEGMGGDADFARTRAKLLPEVNRELARRAMGRVPTGGAILRCHQMITTEKTLGILTKRDEWREKRTHCTMGLMPDSCPDCPCRGARLTVAARTPRHQ